LLLSYDLAESALLIGFELDQTLVAETPLPFPLVDVIAANYCDHSCSVYQPTISAKRWKQPPARLSNAASSAALLTPQPGPYLSPENFIRTLHELREGVHVTAC